MKRPEEIETDIEQTRGAMSGTLQAIERKLSPNRLVDEAMDTMRKMTMSDAGLVGLARDNPVPVALVGLGLGWLALSSLRGSSHSLAAAVQDTEQDAAARAAEKAEEWAGYGADGGNGLKRGLAAKARERIGDVAQNLGESAQKWTEATRSGVDGLGRRVSRQAEDLADVFQDHPLTVGLVALVAGVALGAAIPRTRRETELLGDTAAELLASARETGRQAIQKAGRVVERAAGAVSEGVSEGRRQAH